MLGNVESAPREPFFRRPMSRQGFMLLVSLIAVAIGGLIMVSTSPDLSGAAASLKSRELSLALGSVRREVSQRPLYLTTTDFTFTAGGSPREYRTGDYLTTEVLYNQLDALRLRFSQRASGQMVADTPDTASGQPSSFLTTVAVDPYVPLREWYNPLENPTGVFWGASFNAVKNPTFRTATALEAYVQESLWIYHVRKNADNKDEIWRTDRMGENATTVVTFRNADNRAPVISPDGTRVAFQSSRRSGWDVYVVSDDGSLETAITDTLGIVHETAPIWSPTGDRLAFLREKNGVPDSGELVVVSASGQNASVISTGALTIYPTHDWSPDGRWLAYAYKKSSMSNPRLALYDMFLGDHKLGGKLGENGPEVSEDVQLAFSPNSNDLLYGTPGAGGAAAELWVKPELKTNPIDSIPRKVADSSEGPFFWCDWIPDSVRPASNVTGRWVLYTTGSSRFPGAPCLVRQRLPASSATQLPFLVSRSNPIDPKSVSLSQFGSTVAYQNAVRNRLYRAPVDGAWEDLVMPRTYLGGGAAPPPPLFSDRTAFGATRDFWTLPPANAQFVNSATKANFDANAWRAFVGSQADYDGDNRFGNTYLRLSPPGRQKHFLLDNGTNTFLVEDDPDLRGRPHTAVKTFLSKVTPSWSPRGLTFIGRKAKGAAGEAPVECFKEAVDVSATTVLITTGFDPALSPDDKWCAVAKPMVAVTTDVPARTSFPITNLDLWLSNAVGAPEPPPVNLTPNTPNAQERAPSWSPDGRYIYFQRETQEQNPFLGNHNSTIWRITVNGGAATEVVGNSQCAPFWNDGQTFRSRVELYAPAVSPDGMRLAFIGKERILNTIGTYTSGDVIGEMIYVKDLLYNKEPVLLLRSCHPDNPNKPPGDPSNNNYGFSSLSWAPNGEELYAVRMAPINKKFPQETEESHVKKGLDPDYKPTSSEIIRVVPKDPSTSERGTAGVRVAAGLYDPANDNFLTLMSAGQISGFSPGEQILNAKYSSGAYVYQRVSSDRPVLQNIGISSDVWYVLSGYVRTSTSANHWHRGQIMTQVFNNRGMLVPQTRNTLEFESGLVDLGGPNWSRFSAALKFDAGLFSENDIPPYTVNLCLYSTSEEVGSFVEFTGIKLEKAFDQTERYPTAFAPDWAIFSASKEPDPSRPGYFLFER